MQKGAHVFITFVVLLFLGSCAFSGEASKRPPRPSQTCKDSDDGINIYVKGITKGLAANDVMTKREDSCWPPNYYGDGFEYVAEWFCQKDLATGKEYAINTNEKCPFGCKDGACLKAPSPETVCKPMKRGTGKINFLVIPDRNIPQASLADGTFITYTNEVLFGKTDAYYYSRDRSTANKPALGMFDITPLNEYTDFVNVYYFKATTDLDCELLNIPGTTPQTCSASRVESLAQRCAVPIHKIIVLGKSDEQGWDAQFSTKAFFVNHKLNYYTVPGASSPLPFFESGRVAAHELGHSFGFGHVQTAPGQFGFSTVQDVYQESLRQIVPFANCDTFQCTKWCKGANLDLPCFKNFQEFMNQIGQECGTGQQALDCQRHAWNAFVAAKGVQPIDLSCNIGIDCLQGTGCYTSVCGGNELLASAGDSVMGSDLYGFNGYEVQLVRNAMNQMNQ